MGTQPPARTKARRAAAKRERELAARAASQHGVLTRRQLLDAGLGVRTIARRIEAGRLHRLHREVYAFGSERVDRRGRWMAAVLACGDGALLSHRTAATLWGLTRPCRAPIEVSSASGRGRPGITVHEAGLQSADRAIRERIPVTTVPRTLLDLAEVVDDGALERASEEADRIGLLELRALEDVCARNPGRHGLRPVRRLIEAARAPAWTRSDLEDRFQAFCRRHNLPPAQTNVTVLDQEVDVFWPGPKLVVEVDGWSFHRHRAAFERDRARDAAMVAAGYRVIRLTQRRLEREAETVAVELGSILESEERRAGS